MQSMVFIVYIYLEDFLFVLFYFFVDCSLQLCFLLGFLVIARLHAPMEMWRMKQYVSSSSSNYDNNNSYF